jgi:uncharacterized protein YqiB (DUF1249 family)
MRVCCLASRAAGDVEKLYRFSRVAIFPLILIALILGQPTMVAAQGNQDQAQAIGQAFLEAEAKEWVKTWLNQHPPVSGIEGFGGKAMFAVQLIIAADAYLKADTDKARFHASLDGAAAYVAYSYSATPAVGLIVTAVYLVASIVESNIAGSYQEAMLAIQKDMLATQMRLNDLIYRNGLARANRLLALVDIAQQVGVESSEADLALRLECRKPTGDYASLAGCLEKMTKAVVLRRQLLLAVNRLLSLPIDDLAMLGAPTSETENGDMPKQTLPKTPEDVSAMGQQARERLTKARDEAKTNLQQIEGLYDGFATTFDRLAVNYLVADTLEDEERLSALKDVKHRCLLDHTVIGQTAATVSVQIATIAAKLSGNSDPSAVLKDAMEVNTSAINLLASWEQRRISCPSIGDDKQLSRSMEIVAEQIETLPSP